MFSLYYFKFIYLYFLNFNLFLLLRSWHASCQEMSYSKREAKLKKWRKTKNFPFTPFNYSLSHRTDFHLTKTSYSCGISSPGLCPIHSPLQTLAIHFYPGPISLLAWHQNLLSLNTPSRYQSISSMAYPLNDYLHILLHRLLVILSLSILSTWLNHHWMPSSILSSRPFLTPHYSLSMHSGFYPSS